MAATGPTKAALGASVQQPGGQKSRRSSASKGRISESYFPRRTNPAFVTLGGNYKSAPNSFHYNICS